MVGKICCRFRGGLCSLPVVFEGMDTWMEEFEEFVLTDPALQFSLCLRRLSKERLRAVRNRLILKHKSFPLGHKASFQFVSDASNRSHNSDINLY